MSNTKIKIISGLKAFGYSVATALVTFIGTGKNPFAKDTWYLWAAPVIVGFLKGADKGATLKKLEK